LPGNYATPIDYNHALHAEIGNEARLRSVYGSAFMRKTNDVRLSTICESAAKLLRSRGSDLVMLTDSERRVIASWRADENYVPPGPMVMDETICQHNLLSLEDGALSLGDLSADERVCMLPLIEDHDVRAYLGVPIVVDAHVIGAFCVFDDKKRNWSSLDVMLLTGFAEEAMAIASIG
jgi:GAF domain-containing protein